MFVGQDFQSIGDQSRGVGVLIAGGENQLACPVAAEGLFKDQQSLVEMSNALPTLLSQVQRQVGHPYEGLGLSEG